MPEISRKGTYETNDAEEKEQAVAKATLPKIRPTITQFNEEKGYPLSWSLPAPPKRPGLLGGL